jgi:hypothetical protein
MLWGAEPVMRWTMGFWANSTPEWGEKQCGLQVISAGPDCLLNPVRPTLYSPLDADGCPDTSAFMSHRF